MECVLLEGGGGLIWNCLGTYNLSSARIPSWYGNDVGAGIISGLQILTQLE